MINVKPFGQPSTMHGIRQFICTTFNTGEDVQFVKFPRAWLAVFLYSFGVAAGKATVTAKQRLTKGRHQDECMYSRNIHRELVLDTLLHLEYKACFSYRGLRSRMEGKVEVRCVTDKRI